MYKRKLILYIASSLDGYIATKEDKLDWLFASEGEGDNGYSLFYDSVDTILLGRVTYDWIIEQEKDNFPYRGKECYVFSKSKKENTEHVTFVNNDLVQFVKNLKNKDGKNIWVVGGSELLNQFMKEELVDELIILVSPVLIGNGIPLFKDNNFQTVLSLVSVKRLNQFAELHYKVKRK